MSLICFVDTETTGLKPEKDRICEIAILVYDLLNWKESIRYHRIINPEVSIPPKLTAIHKIGNADVIGCPTFRDVASLLAKLFGKVSYFVAHNAEFDASFILNSFIRCGVPLQKFPIVVDTLTVRSVTPDGKAPTLGEMAWSLDVDYDTAQAHGALYDTEVLARCMKRLLDLNVFTLPEKENDPE